MRLLPRSLFARLALLLFAVLLVAQLVALGIQLSDRAQVFYRAVGLPLAQQLATAVERIEAMPPPQREERLALFGGPRLRLALRPGPKLDQSSDAGWRGLLLTRLLRREFGEERPLHLALVETPTLAMPPPMQHPGGRLGRDESRMRRHMSARGQPQDGGIWIQVELGLDDGRWLTVERHLPRDALLSPARMLTSLGVLLLAVLLVSLLAVRWLTRPLDRLASAADTLGRDLDQPPLPETGPDEMRLAAKAFNTMQARLQVLVNDRARLLAAISHDLKTPLTRMRLRAELLEENDLRTRLLADINEMTRLVETSLDFVRDATGDELARPLDIDALLGSLQADYEDTGRLLAIEGQATAPFSGRPLALRRCLANLVDNAFTYAGAATVEIQDAPKTLELRVVDRGPGLPDEALERVLEPFQRGEASRSRATGGTGLGLAIARSIARAHGGDLTLANRPGGGLVARLRLPR